LSIVAKVYRGDLVDLTHIGHAAVVDYSGKILYSCGDPYRVTFARSSAKPIQAIPAYESGAVEYYGITDDEAVIFSGSHSGEACHVDAVKSVLSKAGLSEECLQCGTHVPFAHYVAKELSDKGLDSKPVHNNCSGKHASMLITAKYLNEDLNTYYILEHPAQKRIMKTLSDVCDYEEKNIITAVDGCGVPVHAMPLYKFAQGFARLSKPDVFEDERAQTVNSITNSMMTYPEMIGGINRIDTDLMNLCGDRLFAKAGAAAYYAVGLKDRGIGISFKIEDGSNEVLNLFVLEVLKQLDIITSEELKKLERYYILESKNHKGEIVGHTKAEFKLIKSY
jgi:L-asparaginase II